MKRADITDKLVCQAYAEAERFRDVKIKQVVWAYDILMIWLPNVPLKVCLRAIERAHKHGFVDSELSFRSGCLTTKGLELAYGPQWRDEIDGQVPVYPGTNIPVRIPA